MGGGERGAEGFARYHAATEGAPPRKTLLFALAAFAREPGSGPRLALDLGCGAGRDAVAMLAAGWRVLAVDAEAGALAALRTKAEAMGKAEFLATRTARLEAIDLPRADLVNASFALPLAGADAFGALWRRVRAALRPGGRFAGHLFGPRDGWATPRAGKAPMAIHDRGQAEALLTGLAIEMLEEEETDGTTPRGEAKHWHILHVVARRPPD